MNRDELEALEVGSVILDRDCDMWIKIVPADLPGPRWSVVSDVDLPIDGGDHIGPDCDLISRPLAGDLEEQIGNYLLMVGSEKSEDTARAMAGNIMAIVRGNPNVLYLLKSMIETREEWAK